MAGMTNALSTRNHETKGARGDAPRGVAAPPSEREVIAALAAGPQRMLDVGAGRLAYWRFGQGPDLVFVHGWPLHAATFRRLVPGLADAFTCHLLDLPSVGHSDTPAGVPPRLRGHAAALRAAVDALGLSSYALLAHDSGALFARLVAAEDARVAGLVMGNTEIPGHTPPLLTLYALAARLPGGAAIFRASLGVGALRRSSFVFGGCFEDPRTAEGEFFELFVRPMLDSGKVLAGQTRLLRSSDFGLLGRLAETHARIKAPSLLVWGVDDPWFPIAKARDMLAQFPGGAELREIPRAKLLAHEDHPEAFVAHARPFLLDCFGAGATAGAGDPS